MISLDKITHLTCDCYGTLIDRERGILKATQPDTVPTPDAIAKPDLTSPDLISLAEHLRK